MDKSEVSVIRASMEIVDSLHQTDSGGGVRGVADDRREHENAGRTSARRPDVPEPQMGLVTSRATR